MEGNTNNPGSTTCGCNHCGHWHGKGGAFLIIRLLVAILLALVIFWGGFMLGELHVMTHGGLGGRGGYGSMGGWSAQPMMRYNVGYGTGTMGGGTAVPPATKNIPPTTATQ